MDGLVFSGISRGLFGEGLLGIESRVAGIVVPSLMLSFSELSDELQAVKMQMAASKSTYFIVEILLVIISEFIVDKIQKPCCIWHPLTVRLLRQNVEICRV